MIAVYFMSVGNQSDKIIKSIGKTALPFGKLITKGRAGI